MVNIPSLKSKFVLSSSLYIVIYHLFSSDVKKSSSRFSEMFCLGQIGLIDSRRYHKASVTVNYNLPLSIESK